MDLQSAAQRLGVHYQTAYRWVRDGRLSAAKVGASYDVGADEVERLRAERTRPRPAPATTRVRDWPGQVDRLHRALVVGDELAARQVFDRLYDGGVELLVLCTHLVSPALHMIGEEWQVGRISVAVEHRASAICERMLARVSRHHRGRPRGVCVVATPPGEEHGLPAIMATLVLRADHWQVHHVGTEVPPDDLADLVKGVAADFVVLSVVNPAATDAAADEGRHLSRAGVGVLVGSPGRTLAELRDLARGARSTA